MTLSSPLAIAAASLAVLALSAPAIAKTPISKGARLCTAAAEKLTPAPKNVRIDDKLTTVSADVLTYTLKVRQADDSDGKIICTVDRKAGAAQLGEWAKN